MTQPMGIVHDMPFEHYLEVPAVSASGLKLLAQSPWHYKNRTPREATKRMLNGTLTHCAVLEPDALSSRYVVVPDEAPRRPSVRQWNAKKPSAESMAAMDWWRTFEVEAQGRAIVDAGTYEITRQQIAAIRANAELAERFTQGRAEVSVFWIDEATGVYCKARADWLHMRPDDRASIIDLKATADESPAGFGRTVANLRYHLQDAHYTAGFKAAGLDVSEFVFAAVSSAPPVLAVAYHLDEETRDQARDERDELLALYAECLRTGMWPSHTEGINLIGLPAWARRSDEMEVSFAS